MKYRKIITRIALGVAAAALVFSVITLIRAIAVGADVLFAAIQVTGTLIIVAICAVMLYIFRGEDELEEEDEPDDDDSEEKPGFEPEPPDPDVFDTEEIEKKYNLKDFD